MAHDADLPRLSAEIDTLIHRVEKISDAGVRDDVIALLQSVMALHAESIRGVIEILSREGETGRAILAKLGSDELISGVLLLHDLHPDATEVRIHRALDRVNEKLRPQNIRAELLGVQDAVARVRMSGKVEGCMSSVSTAQQTIEDTVYEAAPEIATVQVEDLISRPIQADQLVQLQLKSSSRATSESPVAT